MVKKEGKSVKNLVERVRRLGTRRDDGASAVEYGLLVALIAVVIASAVTILGTTLRDTVEESCRNVASTAEAADDCAP
jgi:pilus assembly protein Flp/PilA